VATPCLVLKVVNFGDADRIVTLLTQEFGKVSALAKGARTSRRRFGAALASFGYGEALLEERPGQELFVLSELHMSQGFPNLPLELCRFGYAAYACELCLHLCPPQVPEPRVLRLLVTMLDELDRLPLSQKPKALLLRAFELQVLSAVGLALQIEDCAACGDVVPDAPLVPLDVERGGVLCSRCYKGPIPTQLGPRGGGLSAELRATLSQLSCLALERAIKDTPGIDFQTQQLAKELLLAVVRRHIGHELRSVEFIAKVNAFQTTPGTEQAAP